MIDDPGQRPAPPPADPRCVRCGYSLRGLPGNPIRCPECFHENSRSDLSTQAGPARQLRALQGAGDAFVLATIAMAGGAGMVLVDFYRTLALTLLVLGGLLAFQSLHTARRLLERDPEWRGPLSQFLSMTCMVAFVPAATWLGCTLLSWRLRGGEGSFDLVDLGVGFVIGATIFFVFRPLRRIRRAQRRAFILVARVILGPGVRIGPVLRARRGQA